ncbi:hypothetical protein PQC39_gp139 [Vibrio phage Vp_R1]|uniref:Uncharacterized protein n=1 Tax=Vibrio phage Vp_R1 TaxID=2059867 RepID=A0A2H5BQ88_9CAUD|nr:hypothetical protein PQC39_gp139 [Vibrio phage Vp_R1]AUG88503.1 hypothetical protein VPR_139 [Vibrio phage Vp_R1]
MITKDNYGVKKVPLPCPKRDFYTFYDAYDEYYTRLLQVLTHATGGIWNADPHERKALDAEDLAQETFLRLLVKWESWHDHSGMNTIISMIAAGYLRKWELSRDRFVDFRKHDDDNNFLAEEFEELQKMGSIKDMNSSRDPFEVLSLENFVKRKANALEALTGSEKELLKVVFHDGMSLKDAAVELDMTYVAVRLKLMRIRQFLGDFDTFEEVGKL